MFQESTSCYYFWPFLALALKAVCAAPLIEDCDVLELTHDLSNAAPRHPVHMAFRYQYHNKSAFGSDGQYYWQSNTLEMSEHLGTHMDAPVHFIGSNMSVEQVPYKNLAGEACVLHLAAKAAVNPDYGVTVDDLRDWESRNGQIHPGCVLLADFGWDKYWLTPEKFLGVVGGNYSELHFPGFSGEAADWLVKNRPIRALGADVLSLDVGISEDLPTHRLLLAKNIPLFENIKNLGALPERGATIVALPVRWVNGTGAPTRAFAIGWNGLRDPCRRDYKWQDLTRTLAEIMWASVLKVPVPR